MKTTTDELPGQRGEAAIDKHPGAMRRVLDWLGHHKGLVRLIVLALIVAFVALFIKKIFGYVPAGYRWQFNIPLLALGFVLLVSQEVSFAFIWRAILARLGSQLDIRSAQQIYLGSEFVRYIPGNVWHVFTRILWAERRGVPRVTGLASMTLELATKITSAALVFAASLLFWTDLHGLASSLPSGLPLVLGLLGVPVLLIGLHPRLLTATLNAGLRLLKKPPVAFTLRYRDVLLITLCWAASWVVAGAGFYFVVLALAPAPLSIVAFVIATGIYAIGWDIGFVSFITPSGLGFREAAVALLLGLAGLAPGLAVPLVIALVARLLSTGAELVCVSGAHLLPGGKPPALAVPDAPDS
ncbi:MAG TPA: lysylphosphatidylglycerol synthase domain-containing protein [Ktedonobacterales bacterium]|nr:lysylphosphatidylglycerol synthase domain-containing protein [Ktedonobacterales bacterium]